ncbi:MAG: hypothetical protein LC737_02895 [Chloroflexi bacterium]|nr:hypothetical protein [Chloroflexota bacterium]
MRHVLILILMFALSACGAQGATAVAPTSTAAPTTAAPRALSTAAPASAAVPTSTAIAPAPTASALSESVNPSGEHVLGKPDAPITLTDYSDFL